MPPLGVGQFNRPATFLASAQCFLLGKLNETMGLRVFFSFEMATNIEAQVLGFLFDLSGYHRRHRASVHLTGDHRDKLSMLSNQPSRQLKLQQMPVSAMSPRPSQNMPG